MGECSAAITSPVLVLKGIRRVGLDTTISLKVKGWPGISVSLFDYLEYYCIFAFTFSVRW